jgi:hypothetical protein
MSGKPPIFASLLLLPGLSLCPGFGRVCGETPQEARLSKVPRDFRAGVTVAMEMERQFGLS